MTVILTNVKKAINVRIINMNDETLIEAINDYSFYTAKQRKVLILMIKLAVDDIVTVGSKFLEKKA